MAREPKTTIYLPELTNTANDSRPGEGVARLDLSTHKSGNGQLVSTASVMWEHNGMSSCILFGDFSKRYEASRERATQKNLDHQHSVNFCQNNIDAIKINVLEFYAAKTAKREAA